MVKPVRKIKLREGDEEGGYEVGELEDEEDEEVLIVMVKPMGKIKLREGDEEGGYEVGELEDEEEYEVGELEEGHRNIYKDDNYFLKTSFKYFEVRKNGDIAFVCT